MVDDDLLDRFLNACEDATRSLSRQRNRRFTGLGQAVRESGDHPVVAKNAETLRFLASLRNTIQHSARLDGKPIATPRLDAVLAMEVLAEQIEEPMRVADFMVATPITVTATTPLPEAARLIIQHSLSQLPVLNEAARFDWLLTTNALPRWMGARYDADGGALIEEGGTVADVRPYGESHDVGATVAPNYPAHKACDRLVAADAPTAS